MGVRQSQRSSEADIQHPAIGVDTQPGTHQQTDPKNTESVESSSVDANGQDESNIASGTVERGGAAVAAMSKTVSSTDEVADTHSADVTEDGLTRVRRENEPVSATAMAADATETDATAHDAYWRRILDGVSFEPFPDLSGLRTRAKGNGHGRATISLPENTIIEPAALEAAWVFLLQSYAEADEPESIFLGANGLRRVASQDLAGTNADVIAKLVNLEADARDHPLNSDIALGSFDTAISFGEHGQIHNELAVLINHSGLALTLKYSERVLSLPAAECILRQLLDIAINISRHPNGVFLDNASSLHLDLQASINTRPERMIVPESELLHSAFERNAAQHPDKLALWFKGDDGREIKWTYAELNNYANRLARAILEIEADIVDTAIPLCMEKTPELYVAILGVLKAGAAWCPIDPAFPPLRKRDLMTRAGGKVILVRHTEDHEALIRDEALPTERDVKVLAVADFIQADAAGSSKNVVSAASPNTLAYLIWTSGTTGAPKGVPIEHAAAVQSIAAMHQDIPYDPSSEVRCLQFAAFTFDVSVQDFFYTWGAPRGILCSASRSLLLGSFPRLCNQFSITHAFLTPAFMATTSLAACPTIKTLTSIGEKLPDAVADAWCAPGVVSINTYGPAESTIVSTVRTWTPGEAAKAHNVGRPLATISCFAVHGDRVMPRGAAGELAIGGFQNARGYLAQPDKTAAKFVDHPVVGKVYLTGDVVRILYDGTIEFVGRTDDLIKLGGVRIELSEISALITSDTSDWGPVATLQLSRPDRPQKIIGSFIAAPNLRQSTPHNHAIVGKEAADVARQAREAAKATLPSYMVPNVFIIVPRIPTTASNKIDRTALANIYIDIDLSEWETLLSSDPQTASRSAGSDRARQVSDAVRAAVSALTAVPVDSIDDGTPLNALGIDSIRAIQLAAVLREQQLGREITILDVLEHPTTRDLAKYLIDDDRDHGAVDDSALKTRQHLEMFNEEWLPRMQARLGDGAEVESVLPCLPIQEGMLMERSVHHRAYWSHTVLHLREHVDLQQIAAAWQRVADATDMLRTGYVLAEGDKASSSTFLQVLYKKYTINWRVSVPRQARDIAEVVSQQAEEVMAAAIDSVNPPWAISVVQTAPTSWSLIFSAHHVIYDAETIKMILSDVAAEYSDKPPTSHPRIFDVLCSVLTNEDAQSAALAFWMERLKPFANSETQGLPDLTGQGRQAQSQRHGHFYARHSLTLAPNVLAEAARSMGGSLSQLIAVAWALVIGAYTETSQVVFGETLSARRHAHALGPLLTVSPATVDLGSGTTPFTAISALATLSADSVSHRGVPVSAYRHALAKPAGKNIWDTMFVVHPAADDEPDYHGLWSVERDVVPFDVEHGLALNVELCHDHVGLELGADCRLMSRPQLDLLLRQVNAAVSAVVANPHSPLSDLSSLHLPEDVLSISEPDCPSTVYTAMDRPVPVWLEYYAERQPDWTAVILATRIESDGADSISWTYQQLNDMANQVAHFISSRGVSNSTIAFCVPRSLEGFAYQIGIFKTNNCYLPVEEDLPVARKELLVADSNAAMVFTTVELAGQFANIPDGVQLIVVDQPAHQQELSKQATTNHTINYHKDAPGYLLYTSGSTGKPKGVLISHGNLAAFVESLFTFVNVNLPAAPTGGTGRWLGRTSIAFDVHLLEVFVPFRFGMATVGASRHVVLADLGNTLRHLQITHCCLVPSLLERSGLTPVDVPHLRFASVGGEKISLKVIEVWGDDPNGMMLFNAYGPTEVTIGCTLGRVTPTSSPRDIGHAYAGTRALVYLPGTNKLALKGQTGELCMAGVLTGIGYLNRPDAQGFTLGHDGTKIYRTGDMVRMLADNRIEYLGRSDDQTKIRGQRLELAEVSAALLSVEKGSAVTSLVDQHPSMKRDLLLSFISMETRAAKDDDDQPQIQACEPEWRATLVEHCREKLPSYMVPDLIIPVDFIPVALISRKVDAKILRKLFKSTPLDVLMGTTAPKRDLTELEIKIRDAILQFAVGSGDIGPSTTITNLGLDSLATIRLGGRLSSLGMRVPISFLATGPSIESIAKKLQGNLASDTKSKPAKATLADVTKTLEQRVRTALPTVNFKTVLPCLPIQSSMVTRSLDAPSSLYVNHIVLEIDPGRTGDFDRALQAVIAENEILRTCFLLLGREVVQVVLNVDPLSLPLTTHDVPVGEDLSSFVPRALLAVADDIISQLSSSSPLRANVWKRGQEARLVLSLHHAIYDGETIPMLLQEIQDRIYNIDVPARTPFAAMLSYHLGVDQDLAKQFFTQYLTGLAPQPELPVVEDPSNFMTLSRKLEQSLEGFEATARSTGVNLHLLAKTAFAAAVSEQYSCNDLVIGVVLSGRTIAVEEVDRILGPCVTTVPTRFRIASGSSLLDLAKTVRRNEEGLLAHQHTSLQDVLRWTNFDGPLFTTLFSFTRASHLDIDPALWKELPGQFGIDYPLALEVVASTTDNSVTIGISCMTELGPAAEAILERTASFFANPYQSTLLANGDRPLREQRMLYDEGTWNKAESIIRTKVAETCEVDESVVTKNIAFLRLGLDSISSIRLAQALRGTGLSVRSSDILRFPTVGALANHLTRSSSGTDDSVVANFTTLSRRLTDERASSIPLLHSGDNVERVFPATALQMAMLTSTLASSGTLYVVPHVFELDPGTHPARLKLAFETVVQQREILRTTFHPDEEHTWLAAVHHSAEVEWQEYSSDADTAPVAAKLQLSEPEHFARPAFRVDLVHGKKGLILSLTMHHALYDGTSLGYIFDDLAAAYLGRNLVLRPEFFDALPFVSSIPSDAGEFWRLRLSGSLPVALPASPNAQPARLESRKASLPVSSIERACQALEVTVQAAAMLAWAKVYASITNSPDVVFGHVVSGRSIPLDGALDVAGPLFNTIPVRVAFSSLQETNDDAVKDIHELIARTELYQHTPMRQIVSRWRRETAGPRLFDALFVFQRLDHATEFVHSSEVPWQPVSDSDHTYNPEYAINAEVEYGSDVVVLRLGVKANITDLIQLRTLLDAFDQAFTDILERPSNQARDLPANLPSIPVQTPQAIASTDEHASGDADFDAYLTPDEAALRQVICKVANVPLERLLRRTPFYTIGIDSISAMQVVARAKLTGLNLAVSDVVTGMHLLGTCNARDARLSRHSSHVAAPDLVPLTIRNAALALLGLDVATVETVLPVLPGQEYHLAAWLSHGRVFYDYPFAFESTQPLDELRLSHAWAALRRRHPILRTTFALVDKQLVQVIMNPLPDGQVDSSLRFIEASGTTEDAVKGAIAEHLAQPSDLFSPPVRAMLVRADGRDVVAVILHHALYDGWSLPLLLSDLVQIYAGDDSSELLSLPEVPQLVRHIAETNDAAAAEAFWREYIGNTTPTQVQVVEDATPDSFVFEQSAIDDISPFVDICGKRQLAPSTAVIIALGRAVSQTFSFGSTPPSSLLVGLFQTGRSLALEGVDRLAAPTLTILPLLVPVVADAVETIRDVQGALSRRSPFEQTRLPDIQQWLGVDGPLFNVYLNVLWAADRLWEPEETTAVFKRLEIGDVQMLSQFGPFEGRTAVDGIDMSYIAKNALHIDVALAPRSNAVAVGVRCEGAVASKDTLHLLVQRFKAEVEDIMQKLA